MTELTYTVYDKAGIPFASGIRTISEAKTLAGTKNGFYRAQYKVITDTPTSSKSFSDTLADRIAKMRVKYFQRLESLHEVEPC